MLNIDVGNGFAIGIQDGHGHDAAFDQPNNLLLGGTTTARQRDRCGRKTALRHGQHSNLTIECVDRAFAFRIRAARLWRRIPPGHLDHGAETTLPSIA